MMHYTVRRVRQRPQGRAEWNGTGWETAETARVDNFRPESSSHRPDTRVRLLYDDRSLYGIFRVRDRFVRCVHTRYQDPVCGDSCVEFFVRPRAERGYFNFEFNCGGAMLLYYVTNPERTASGLRKSEKVPHAWEPKIHRFTTQPPVTNPEITEPMEWRLEFSIPLDLFTRYMDTPRPLDGQTWRGNFYKCGDLTSHPHWASWAPVNEKNFHLPACFGTLHFEQGEPVAS